MISRRAMIIGGGVLGAGLVNKSLLFSDKPRISRGYTSPAREEEIIASQPGLDSDVPTIWGRMITTANSAKKAIDWDAWNPPSETKPYRETDFDSEFLVFIVGVLHPGYDLLQAKPPEFRDGELIYEYSVKRYDNSPDKESPDPCFVYEVHKWELNGYGAPETFKINSVPR